MEKYEYKIYDCIDRDLNNETGKRIKRNIGTMTHGGRRDGAGRKPIGEQPKTATIAIRTTEQTKQLIKDEAQKRGVSISQMVEDLVTEKAGI